MNLIETFQLNYINLKTIKNYNLINNHLNVLMILVMITNIIFYPITWSVKCEILRDEENGILRTIPINKKIRQYY